VSLKVSLAVRVRSDSPYSLHDFGKAIRRAGVGSEHSLGHSIESGVDGDDVHLLRARAVVDDPDEFAMSLTEALKSDGLDVLNAEQVSVKLVEAQEVDAPGVDYDNATGTLTVETWSPDWGDLMIDLLRTPDAIRGLMATTSPRVEDGLFRLRRVVVKRPAGGLEDEPKGPGA
jgi:hypothetical protein